MLVSRNGYDNDNYVLSEISNSCKTYISKPTTTETAETVAAAMVEADADDLVVLLPAGAAVVVVTTGPGAGAFFPALTVT